MGENGVPVTQNKTQENWVTWRSEYLKSDLLRERIEMCLIVRSGFDVCLVVGSGFEDRF